MGFVLQWIGRPTTPYAFMSTIRNVLVSAGWTSVYDDGSTRIVVRTAPYLGTQGPVIDFTVSGSHVEIQGHHGWNTSNNTPITPSTTRRRLQYGHATTTFYWVYANEYWFMLINSDSIGNWGDTRNRELGGVLLPPAGITTPPTYHPVFIYGCYDTGGSLETNTLQNLVHTSSATSNVPFFIHPQTGATVRTNLVENLANYTGIPPQPVMVFPPIVAGVFGELPYALITGAVAGVPFSFTRGNERYILLFSHFASLYARIA